MISNGVLDFWDRGNDDIIVIELGLYSISQNELAKIHNNLNQKTPEPQGVLQSECRL